MGTRLSLYSTLHSKFGKEEGGVASSAPSAAAAPPLGLRTNGSRATVIVPIPKKVRKSGAMAQRVAMREMGMEEFTETRGSGTLRKNKRIGMNVASHALDERVAYEFGYPFQACPERFVTWGEPRSEENCKPLTEVGWHVERYASMCLFPGDEMACKYIIVEKDGVRTEGVGIVIRKTSVPWLPKGYMVFCIITEYSPIRHNFLDAVNPC